MLDVNAIMEIIPHRYPFLLVDRILEIEPKKRSVGIKNVTINEPFFQGHYPGLPIMPGVLIVEAMAQIGGLSMMSSGEEYKSKVPLLGGVDEARFRRQVVPGDQLRIEADVLKQKGPVGKVNAKAYVANEIVAEAVLTFMIVDANKAASK